MILNDVLQYKGAPLEILEASKDDLPDFFMRQGYKVGVEIGVDKGHFTEKLCLAGLKVYAVDPWKYYGGFKRNTPSRPDWVHFKASSRLRVYENCTIIRKFSMEAVKDFDDHSIDFVYIDGNHTFNYITEDLYEWNKKVRSGGCISGHDIQFPSVRQAVDNFVISNEIISWFIFDTNYLWIKP